MKKIITFCLFISLLLFSNLRANDALQKVTLQLQWKHQFEFAGFYAAKAKGFYKEVGLDVEFIEYDSKKSIVETVLNKEAEFGLTYSSLIAEFLKGKEVVFVANYFKQSPLVIVTQPSIKTPAMLRNKKVMGVSDNIDNITLKLMLEKFGISLDEIINVPTSYSINEFTNKSVDAMALFTTNEIYQFDQLGIKYNIFNPSLYGHEYYDVNLFTSKEYAFNNPEVVEKFKEASNRGWEYALTHKEEIANLILKEYNSQNKTKDALLFEAYQIEQLMFTKTQKIGYIDPLRVQFIAQNFIESGYVDASRLNTLDSLLYHHPKSIKDDDNPLNLTKKEREFIVQHPKILLGTGDSWEPYSIKRPDGKIVGFDQDILNLVNKMTGANFVLQHGDWATMQELAKERRIDGLATLTMSKERKEFLNFSDRYTFLIKNVYVKQGNPKNIRSLKDLEGKTISVHKGNIADEKFAKSIKSAKIIYSPTQLDMLKEVIYGEADATSGNGATEYMMAKLGLPYMKNAFALDYRQSLHFAVRNDWPEAITILNKGLRAITEEKRIALHSKWFAQVNNFVRNHLNLSPQEQNYLNSKEHITMCVDPDWEPYEFIDKYGNHKGLAADFMQLIEKKINKKIKLIKTKTWEESLKFIQKQKCDILSFVNQSSDRDRYLNFTPTIYSEPTVIATQSSVAYLDGFGALEGKTIGLVKGYITDEYITKHYPKIKIKYIKNYEEGIALVSEGQINAIVNSLLGTAHLIRKSNLIDIKIAGKAKLLNKHRIGVIKEDGVLHSILSKAVQDISQKEKDKILSNWISVKFEQGYNYTLFWQMLSVVILILIALYYRQYTINKLNQKLQAKMEVQLQAIIEKDHMIFEQNKLIAMGEMIENIAHQWRQPLSQINSAVMLIDLDLKQNQSSNPNIESKLLEIESLTKYLSNTIDDFKDFYAKDKSRELFHVTDAINKALSIINASLRYHKIKLITQIDQSLEINSLINELQQVILILLNNAKDALISRNIKAPQITIELLKHKDHIIIKVSDNAGGVEPKHLSKIFEPYFTTKHKSQGTGLGLYIAKLIIEESLCASLEVKNSSTGASFIIKFKVN